MAQVTTPLTPAVRTGFKAYGNAVIIAVEKIRCFAAKKEQIQLLVDIAMGSLRVEDVCIMLH